VEASPEQLAAAAAAADALSERGGRRTRVIGWVHSHPHITSLPSHVDLATQAAYQQLDASFVGLIVAVFDAVRAPARCSPAAPRRRLRGWVASPLVAARGHCIS
jgi:proteasome lid subunit RPN8/RPN11